MSNKQKKPLREKTENEPRRKTPTFLLELTGQRGASETHPRTPGGGKTALQCRALRRTTTNEMHACRSRPGRAGCALPAYRSKRERRPSPRRDDSMSSPNTPCTRMRKPPGRGLAQRLSTRAYHALNRVCLGEGRRVRFKSRGRGLGSMENKRNDTAMRFVLQKPEEGNRGFLIWMDDELEALIDWEDEVVTDGLGCRIKYARLVQRRASSPRAEGADSHGFRYLVQLALEGGPHHKKKHAVGRDIIGADLGPTTSALVPRESKRASRSSVRNSSPTPRPSADCSARACMAKRSMRSRGGQYHHPRKDFL